MLRSSELALIAVTAATSSDAKVLRNKSNAPTVWVFKDADALRRFGKVAKAAVYDAAAATTLFACKAPQGSKIDVLGSGYRTALSGSLKAPQMDAQPRFQLEQARFQLET
jgi:hypothetical protein